MGTQLLSPSGSEAAAPTSVSADLTRDQQGARAGRRTFDVLISSAALLMVAVLAVAGGLLTWGHNYITTQVHNQLAAQEIFFPAANSAAVAAPEFKAMRQYGGQQLTTGAQAEVYADHFIANHLKTIGGGKTYAQLSTEAQAQPNNAALAAQVNTVFKGETLRGLLLNAYAFGTIATIAGIAAIVAFVAAGLLLVLSLLGFYHSRKATRDNPARGDALPTAGPPEPAPLATVDA
jgi:hypothetical protein